MVRIMGISIATIEVGTDFYSQVVLKLISVPGSIPGVLSLGMVRRAPVSLIGRTLWKQRNQGSIPVLGQILPKPNVILICR